MSASSWSRWSARQVALLVGAVAVLLRLPALGRPGTLVFDEIFYAPDAADLLRWGAEHGQPVHPPLGKWLIAGGIAGFGFEPVGWRAASVLAGALLCAVVAWAAVRLTGQPGLGLAAGALVALDGLVHVTSRLALLDVFVALATTTTVAALVGAWTAQPHRSRATRWWWLAVVALALGTAVKWSALALLPLVLVVGWVLAGRLDAPGRPRRARRVVVVGAPLVLPVLAIMGATLPRQAGPDPASVSGYVSEQAEVFGFHRDLRPTNPNAASAWTWVAQQHPVDLYRSDDDGSVVRVIAGANPVVWAVGLAGVLGALVGAFRGRPEAALLVGSVALLWVPFLASPRVSYSFYAVTLVGPMVLAAVWGLHDLGRVTLRRVPGAVVTLAALAFLALWPVWSAQPLSPRVHAWLTFWPGWS